MDMVTSHSLAGQLMLSLVTWMCQLVLRGRRATAPSTPWDTGPCGCSFGWSGKLGEPLRGDSSGALLESLLRGVRYTSLIGC